MNNNGGEIFRIVSTAKSDTPPEWFTTPQEFELASIAKSFQIPFTRIHSISDLAAIDSLAFNQAGIRIIEVMVEKENNLTVRKTFHPVI